MTAGTCRVCGCTDDDCRQCIEKTGEPCYWVDPSTRDLCSACDDFELPHGIPDGENDPGWPDGTPEHVKRGPR